MDILRKTLTPGSTLSSKIVHCLQALKKLTAAEVVRSSCHPCVSVRQVNSLASPAVPLNGYLHSLNKTATTTPSHTLCSGRLKYLRYLSQATVGHTKVWAAHLSTRPPHTKVLAAHLTTRPPHSGHSPSQMTISKNQPVLQVKRQTRKKILKNQATGGIQSNNVVAYAVAEELELSRVVRHLDQQGVYQKGELPQDVTNAIHIQSKYAVDSKPKEIFIFQDGSVVFWCVPEIERHEFLKTLTKFSEGPYRTSLMLFEQEELDFKHIQGKTSLLGDVIHLSEEDKGSPQQLLELYTFSNALAQSVKLAVWEVSLNSFVTSIEPVTEDLRQGSKIQWSRRQVLMKTGELFTLRHLINLDSDLLDTPDFYWDRSVLEPLYLSLCSQLNIARRTRVMNEKLNHCCELTELLSSQLNDAHHTRLEVMIIILILVEVVFEFIHYAERLLEKPTEPVREAVDR